MEVRRECRHFRADVPCRPHKEKGAHCAGCADYAPRAGRILLIKLGAAGDVVRTTPLLEPLRRAHPDHVLTWVTQHPELLPSVVDDPRIFDAATVLWASRTAFDLVLNLDKDREACALAAAVDAPLKRGFTLGDDGLCAPVDAALAGDAAAAAAAADKFLTGLFDDVSRANTKSYLEEIFAIAGFVFAGQEYVLDRPSDPPAFDLPAGKAVVGLNTGCGGRWTSRLWPEAHWEDLARDLSDAGYAVVLLGGPQEDERNRRLAAAAGACYPGHFPLRDFIGLVDRCDVVVTAVTMAMHLAIGLRKRLVLFNNIFNPAEFELYGRGAILAPEQPCSCYFSPRCRADSFCMETLRPATVRAAVDAQLERP